MIAPVLHVDSAARPTRYKAKIDAVFPQRRRATFEREPECFLGVSLENANFVGPKLAGMIEWISRRFSRCTVLVGDSIHRITLASATGCSPDDMLPAALRLGREFVERERPLFDAAPGTTRFEFLTCSDVAATDACRDHHARLLALYASDAAFQSSVDAFAAAHHAKRSIGLDPAELERRRRASAEYFLEEFAIIACLQERGAKVLVYPGTFSTLAEIAEGAHPSAPAPLHDLVTVALCLKGR